jgi:FkbM family methyltransferase
MQSYGSNKLKTAIDIVRRIDNWPTGMELRLRKCKPGLRLLRFRDGLNVVCRGATRDWDVVHELLFAGSYGRAIEYLKGTSNQPRVLDLGGNIGLFSLLAARAHPKAEIHSYEPGPPNYRLFEMNLLGNPNLADRIQLCKAAVGGKERDTEWHFDEANPGGSSLFGTSGTKYRVSIRAFGDVVAGMGSFIDLAKIDIEGAEFELLAETPPLVWEKVRAVSLELHDDPARRVSQAEFLKQMRGYGYRIEEETVCSYFLHR